MNLDRLTFPIVQISLDVTSLDEALDTAAIAVEAGVDWLEAGTPLLLAEGLRAVQQLRSRFPDHPIVADLKTMDGGYLETEMMAKAGANLVVVMGRAHEATIRRVVDAGRDFGVKVMGDNLAARDRVACARRMEDLGVDFIVHHIGFDERHRGLDRVRHGRLHPYPILAEDVHGKRRKLIRRHGPRRDVAGADDGIDHRIEKLEHSGGVLAGEHTEDDHQPAERELGLQG